MAVQTNNLWENTRNYVRSNYPYCKMCPKYQIKWSPALSLSFSFSHLWPSFSLAFPLTRTHRPSNHHSQIHCKFNEYHYLDDKYSAHCICIGSIAGCTHFMSYCVVYAFLCASIISHYFACKYGACSNFRIPFNSRHICKLWKYFSISSVTLFQIVAMCYALLHLFEYLLRRKLLTRIFKISVPIIYFPQFISVNDFKISTFD